MGVTDSAAAHGLLGFEEPTQAADGVAGGIESLAGAGPGCRVAPAIPPLTCSLEAPSLTRIVTMAQQLKKGRVNFSLALPAWEKRRINLPEPCRFSQEQPLPPRPRTGQQTWRSAVLQLAVMVVGLLDHCQL